MSVSNIIFGRLNFEALRFWDMLQHPDGRKSGQRSIATLAACLVLLGAAVTVFLITWAGKWTVLWSEWLTSVDHKRIGIMYVVLAFVMLARALIEAGLMRTQQAFGLGGGFLSPEHFWFPKAFGFRLDFQSGLCAIHDRGADRRRDRALSRCQSGHPALGLRPQAPGIRRPRRRSLGRAQPRMGQPGAASRI